MEEQFYTLTKHASTLRIKSGVSNDGRIVGARMRNLVERRRLCRHRAARHAEVGLHRGRALRHRERQASTPTRSIPTCTPAGALRGFGIPQLVWAYESHTDIIARELGIDPVAFRRQNLLRDGRQHATGTVMHDMGADAASSASRN